MHSAFHEQVKSEAEVHEIVFMGFERHVKVFKSLTAWIREFGSFPPEKVFLITFLYFFEGGIAVKVAGDNYIPL